MPTVVVLLPSTTYRARDFLRAAEGLGIDVIVASDVPPPFDMGDRYLDLDCTDPVAAAERIVGLGDRIAIDGIVAADDGGVLTAAIASERLGIRGNPPASAAAALDKRAQRNAMAVAEMPQPQFRIIGPADDPRVDLRFPVVVKPSDRSASQGVLRADDPDDLIGRIGEVRTIVGEEAELLVEEYMPGTEIALEGILSDGYLTTLAIFDKPESPTGPAFPESVLVTPSTMPDEQQLEAGRLASGVVSAIGLRNGPVHIEMKITGDRIRVLEVAARSIGGLCSRSLSFGLMDTTLETLILRNALDDDRPRLRREPGASGVLMIPIPRAGTFQGLINEEEIRSIDAITGIEMNVPIGTPIDPPPVGDRYLGFVFARSMSRDTVVNALLESKRRVRIDVR